MLITFICVGLIVAGWFLGVFNRPATSHIVTYRITADSGFAMITYTTAKGKQTESERATTPGKFRDPFNSGIQVYLTAGTNSTNGTVACTLLLDHKAWKKETAAAPDSNVACGGIVP